jgi:magnesium transporter
LTDQESLPPTAHLMELYEFSEHHFSKSSFKDIAQIQILMDKDAKFWLNICSLDATDLIQEIATLFDIHPLVLEDIGNYHQRPKLEEFGNFVFVVTKMLYTKSDISSLEIEQVSILFGKNFIITFQENQFDIFDPIRIRLENPTGKMRKMGPDYFAYTLVDAIVDQYYLILEQIGDRIEELEDEIIDQNKKIKLSDIYHERKSILQIKKMLWPTRELLSAWKKSESHFIRKRTAPFINDAYEHTVELIENLELQRESITTLVEIFISNISLKQNEVMKTLTIIATIFIPLTFVAGVYGMNFSFMPELEWKFGYPAIWAFFIVSTGMMIYYFKRKKWF